MEGVSQTIERNEVGADWRERKDEAPAKAEELMSHIEGFDTMNAEQQVETLRVLIENLASDNANRFIASEVARRAALIEENARHESRMAALGGA